MAASTRHAVAVTIASNMSGGKIRIYSAPRPTVPEDTPSGTLLLEASIFVDAPVADTVVIEWDYTQILADGTAAWFQILTADGVVAHDGLAYHQNDPNAPDGALLLPILDVLQNISLAGSVTIPVVMLV